MADLVPSSDDEILFDRVKLQQVIVAVEGVFPDIISRCKRNERFLAMSIMPDVDRLPIPPLDSARKPTPMMPVMIDESTTQGNIDILREIFRKQLRLDDDVFESQAPAFLVAGDNKTLNRIWSAVYGAAGNISQYDKLQHLVAVPGLFHGLMHVVIAITALYWGAAPDQEGGCVSHATLRYVAGLMRRKFVGPNNLVYTHGKTFLTDNYHARMLAEFYGHVFNRHRYQSRVLDRHSSVDDIKALVNSISATEIIHLVQDTARSLCDPEECEDDAERAISLAFVRDFNAFVIFHNGIKHGDIGLVKASLPYLIELFAQTKKRQYVQEFFYLKRLIDSEYTKPEARLAVASALSVNPTGRVDGWFAADLACEFVNRDIKDQWSYRRKSTMSVSDLSEFCTLNAIFFHPLREQLNKMWGRTVRPRHTPTARGIVINNFAVNLMKTMMHNGDRSAISVPGIDIARSHAYANINKQLKLFNIKFLQNSIGAGDRKRDVELDEGICISSDMPLALQDYSVGADASSEGLEEFRDQWEGMDEGV